MREFSTALLVAALAVAVAFTAPSPGATPKDDRFELPMQFIGNMPAVEVMVNGQGPFLFGIDTGAQGRARVDSSLVAKLGLQTVGERQGTDSSERNPQRIQMVRVASIEIAGLRFADVQAGARDYRASPRLATLDGILAPGLFGHYLLTLDYPAKRVRISKAELPKPDGAEVLEYASEGGMPTVELRIGERSVPAHIDSGNMIGGFVVPTALAETLAFESEPVTVSRARTISGEMEIKEARCKEVVRLGRHEFAQPVITFPAPGNVANIGSKVLRDFEVTIDAKNGRLRLARKEQPSSRP